MYQVQVTKEVGMFGALGLIALVLGYKVFVDASKEKEGVKLLGQAIGIFVMIAAVLTIVCGTMKCLAKYGGGCPIAAKSYCPVAAKSVCPLTK